MPPRLKPKSGVIRAVLSNDFIDTLRNLRNAREKSLKKDVSDLTNEFRNAKGTGYKKGARDRLLLAINQLKMITTKQATDISMEVKRGGLEYDIMQLRKLPFVNYEVKRRVDRNRKKELWLIGRTDEIVCKISTGGNRGLWDIGAYFVCVNAFTFGKSYPHLHIIPVKSWEGTNRHMHHFATNRVGNNPLDWHTNTCWGNYNGIIQSLWMDGNVPGIFQMLYKFTSEFNPGSPLLRFGNLPHVRRVESV